MILKLVLIDLGRGEVKGPWTVIVMHRLARAQAGLSLPLVSVPYFTHSHPLPFTYVLGHSSLEFLEISIHHVHIITISLES